MRVMKSRAFRVPPTLGLPERRKAYIRAACRPKIVLETCKTLFPKGTVSRHRRWQLFGTGARLQRTIVGLLRGGRGAPHGAPRGNPGARAREERGMASAGHWSGAVSASSCDGEALSCCICLVWDLVFDSFGGPGGSSELAKVI